MEAALAVLTFQGILGAYDNIRNHEFHEGLPHRSQQQGELVLHAIREVFYLVLFPTMAWLEWRGWLACVLVTVIFGEIVVTCWDFVEEDRTRKLSPNERVLHTILTLNYEAFLGLFAPVLFDWWIKPTNLVFVDRGAWSWIMTVYSVGVFIFGIREMSSGISMRRQMRSPLRGSPLSRVLDEDGAASEISAFHSGHAKRSAQGTAIVRTGGWMAKSLLHFVGLGMRDGAQTLAVTFEPDGEGELWERKFETGRFTSRFETEESVEPSIIEFFGPFAFYYVLGIGDRSIIWNLRRVTLLGIPLPKFLAPTIDAQEQILQSGLYAMSADGSLPLFGHLLSYEAKLVRDA